MSEPFEPSPFMPGGPRAFDNDFNVTSGGLQRGQPDADASVPLPINEKETTRENNVAKIKVVVCWLYWQQGSLFVSVSLHILCANRHL
jgi:kinesin family protein 2/24